MAGSNPSQGGAQHITGFTAAGAIAAYRCCKRTTDSTVEQSTVEGAAVICINQGPNDLVSGDAVPIEQLIFTVEAGAAITSGANLMCSTAGKALTASGSGSKIFAVALSSAAADGDFITARRCGGQV